MKFSALWPFVTKKTHESALKYVIDKLDAEHRAKMNAQALAHASKFADIEATWKAVRDAGERLVERQVQTRYLRDGDQYRVQVSVSSMECYSFGQDERSRRWLAESIGRRIESEFAVAKFVTPPDPRPIAPYFGPGAPA